MSKTKQVSFKEKELYLFDYTNGKDFSYYIKNLIKKDMKDNK